MRIIKHPEKLVFSGNTYRHIKKTDPV
jgi:hypothetical protein